MVINKNTSFRGEFFLTALEPLPRDNWLDIACTAAQSVGLGLEIQSQKIIIWQGIKRCGSLQYADGWVLGRLWLGPARWALGMRSKRIYFSGNTTQLDLRPEWDIVGDRRPEGGSAQKRILEAHSILKKLSGAVSSSCLQLVKVESVCTDLANSRSIYIGENRFHWSNGTLNALYRESGFDSIPKNLVVSVCACDGVSSKCVGEFSKRLTAAAKARHLPANIKLTTIETINRRLEVVLRDRISPRPGYCVIFLFPRHSEIISKTCLCILDKLERARVPYRRAYADDPFEYSIPDQLPSILLAMGGTPHRVKLKAVQPDLWSIGIDLSHRDRTSILAATLVDPDGRLQGAWTLQQPRDETARTKTLVRILREIRHVLCERADVSGILVLRDGRFFEQENAQLYGELLEKPVSLLEYRKRNNPHVMTKSTPGLAPAPCAFCLPETHSMFVSTCTPRTEKSFPNVSKVVWRDEWNQLSISPKDIVRAITMLSATPGLGMHPRHLPAPLYWADGIAGASSTDLRFRGQIVHRL